MSEWRNEEEPVAGPAGAYEAGRRLARELLRGEPIRVIPVGRSSLMVIDRDETVGPSE